MSTIPEARRINNDRSVSLAQLFDHLINPLFRLRHNRNSAQTALGIVAVGEAPLRISVHKSRLMSDGEPVRGQTAAKTGFSDTPLGCGEGDHSEHRITS